MRNFTVHFGHLNHFQLQNYLTKKLKFIVQTTDHAPLPSEKMVLAEPKFKSGPGPGTRQEQEPTLLHFLHSPPKFPLHLN